jgi:hypothetical protein
MGIRERRDHRDQPVQQTGSTSVSGALADDRGD